MTTIAQAIGQECGKEGLSKEQVEMSVAQQLRQEGIQEGMYTKTLDIATKMLSELNLDMQTVAKQLGEKYEQKGRRQEKLSVAKKMLDAHESKEKVHQFTGLSWVEIEQLLRETIKQ